MSKTIGETLKSARKSLGKSISEVAFQTKIREHYLIALEKDDYSGLPSIVQGKGFLRIYAEYLDLNQDHLLKALQRSDHLVIINDEDNLDGDQPISEIALNEQETNEEEISAISPPQTVIIHEFEKNNQETYSTEENDQEKDLSPSQRIFVELGSKLRKQRELLNLSLEDIEKFTNIRKKYLQALKSGKLDDLPSFVQGRGMLNNYGKFLNMDTEGLLLIFAEGLQTKRNERYAPQKLENSNQSIDFQTKIKPPGWRRFITADLLIVSTLIISLFVFVLWGAANLTNSKDTKNTDEPPSISSVLLEVSTQENLPTSTITAAPLAVETDMASITENTNTDGDTLDIPTEGNLPLQIYIIASQRAYLRVTSDNKIEFSGRTVPGNAYEFSGKDVIEILTGNAAALDIYFNQTQLGPIGDTGEVKSYLFTVSDGITTPTPQFTATFTVTPKPSATPSPTNTNEPVVNTLTSTVTPFIP